MNKQITLSAFNDELAKVRTKKKEFLAQIESIIPWGEWKALIQPYYYKGERGNKPYELELMLRLYILQNLYDLSDEGTVAEVIDSRAFSEFCGVDSSNQVPDGDILGRFRNLLMKNGLQQQLFTQVVSMLTERGLILKKGTIVDSTIISAPSSTKNRDKKRDPDAHQTKKGNTWHFGYKAHIGVDRDSGIVHTLKTTAANVSDVTMTSELLHGEENIVNGDSEIITLPLDLSLLRSVRAFAEKVKELGYPIDSFLGNAGISSTPGLTEDGLDTVFETNYLGHALLTWLLLPVMSEDCKILLISSDMHEGLFTPLTYKPAAEVAKPDAAFANSPDRYNFSKLYVLYFVYEMASRLEAAGSKKVINAFNPGLMHTTGLMPDKRMFTEEFLNTMRASGHLGDIDQNSTTVCELMTDDAAGRNNGVYYDRATTPGKSSELSYVLEYRKELWDLSLELTGLTEDTIAQ